MCEYIDLCRKKFRIQRDSRTVDLHVQRLKKKLGLEDTIVSVRKIGYRMEAEE